MTARTAKQKAPLPTGLTIEPAPSPPGFELQGHKSHYHALMHEGRKVGHSGALQSLTHPEISVYGPLGITDKAFRGMGLGGRLIQATLESLGKAGCRCVYMGSGNLPAYFTYLKTGFKPFYPGRDWCSNYALTAETYRSKGWAGKHVCFANLLDEMENLSPLMFFRNMLDGSSPDDFDRQFFDAKGPLTIRRLADVDYVEVPALLNRPFPFVIRNYSLNLFDREPLIDGQMQALLDIAAGRPTAARYFNIAGEIVCLIALKGGVPVGFGSITGAMTYRGVVTKTGVGRLDMLFHPDHADAAAYGQLFDAFLEIARNLDHPKSLRKIEAFLTPGDPRADFYVARGFRQEACLAGEIRNHDLLVYALRL